MREEVAFVERLWAVLSRIPFELRQSLSAREPWPHSFGVYYVCTTRMHRPNLYEAQPVSNVWLVFPINFV